MGNENTNNSKLMVYDELLATAIINNNYAVQSIFDDISEGFVSNKFLSKEEADGRLSTKKRGHLTSYRVVGHLAIVGIIPFNSHVAYVFNKKLPACNTSDKVNITCDNYESLMDCYVFHSEFISKELLKTLENEYYKRGGVVYEKYHSFEEIELRKIRKQRRMDYRNTIVFDSIFKHGFREIGNNKWTDGDVLIKQKQTQRSVFGYPAIKTHTELDIGKDKMMLIGSIFAPYLQHINQLSDNSFGIVCNKSNSSKYHFTCFEVEFDCI